MTGEEHSNELNVQPKHHSRLTLCTTRPSYRQGRKLLAVKAFSINAESQHLFIYGVPQLNLRSEIKHLCTKYGHVLNCHVVSIKPSEPFVECYHVQYERIQSARIAKRLIDNKLFYGSALHVCYAPEEENLTETRMKLFQRHKDVLKRNTMYIKPSDGSTVFYQDFKSLTRSQLHKKRKMKV